MAVKISVPSLGESVSEATIGKWYKKIGESVTTDELLVELETDKITIDVPSPGNGVLTEITVKEGENVETGAVLGFISEIGFSDRMPPSPSASKLIAENSLDPKHIYGSGKRGQILKEDILSFSCTKEQGSKITKNSSISYFSLETHKRGEERVRMSKLRETIARRLKDAQNTAAMLTTFNEVDMSALVRLRKLYQEMFQEKYSVKLGFMGFFTRAVCHAIREIPVLNAEIDNNDIIYKNYVHIGIAVGTDKGLVVPVIHDVDQMSLAEIEKEITRLSKFAREGKLSITDMQGGTFTITNGGIYGSLMSTPILNSPQSGILGMHTIKERPVVIEGQVCIRPMMYLAVSYDHRIVDGQEAVIFLVRIKECLENPERFILNL